MSLATLQRYLAQFTSSQEQSQAHIQQAPTDPDLSETEKRWLLQVATSQGLQVTQDIKRWWRAARLRSTLPLSVRWLEQYTLTDLINRFLDATTCRSLFLLMEARQFQQFIAELTEINNELIALVAFEIALRQANMTRNNTGGKFNLTIVFPCDPVELIQRLTSPNKPSAITSGCYEVTVDSTLENLWLCHQYAPSELVDTPFSQYKSIKHN